MTIWHNGYTLMGILLLSTTEVVISGKNKSNKSKNKQKPIINIMILYDVSLKFYQYSGVNFWLYTNDTNSMHVYNLLKYNN
jgi:hypothetical protein